MLGFLDNLTATDEEHSLSRRWADYARQNFGDGAADKLEEGLLRPTQVKSKKALRLAVRRAETMMKTMIVVPTR